MYLVITIRFLSDRYHGRTDNGRVPEWPPSPLRLFQAILAGAAGRWHDLAVRDRELPAFEWLENLGEPPAIIAPAFRHGRPLLKYVRENLSDIDPEKRDKKVSRPTLFCGEPTLTYFWAINSNEVQPARIIADCARRCRALGWGIDMAIGDGAIMESEPEVKTGEKWLPMPNAEEGVPLRVPQPPTRHEQSGSLNELRSRFAASLKRIAVEGRNPVPPLSAFRLVAYRRATDPPSRPYAAFAFYEPDSSRRRPFPAGRAIAVAGMVRFLAGKMARQTGHHDPNRGLDAWVNDYVMGHGEADGLRPRFSYLPLLTIRPPNILSAINRVIIAEPPGGNGEHVAWVRRALRGQVLISKEGNEVALLMAAGSDDKVLARYVGASDTWATVTPVVLPGSDDGKFAKAEKLFFKALGHAGYSSEGLAELEFRNVSFWPGGELALRFHRPDYLKNGYWSVYHVRLRWKNAIKGPIALGAGRHCGLGIFAAID